MPYALLVAAESRYYDAADDEEGKEMSDMFHDSCHFLQRYFIVVFDIVVFLYFLDSFAFS